MLPDSHVIDNEGHVTEETNESKSSDDSDVLKFYTSLSDEIDPRYTVNFVAYDSPFALQHFLCYHTC